MSLEDEIYQVADELRGLANLGLRFASDPYDTERYEKVLSASARLIAALESRDPAEILENYQDNMGHMSPLVGAEAVVIQDGKVLLVQRTDNQKWALPAGWWR